MSEVEPTAKEMFAGVTVEIDHAGDYVIDTSEALGGDVILRLGEGRAFSVEIGNEPVLEICNDGSSIRIDLGGGATERLVLGDSLKAALDAFFQQKFDLHMHPTSMGPSGPPLPAFTGTQLGDDVLSDVSRTKKS